MTAAKLIQYHMYLRRVVSFSSSLFSGREPGVECLRGIGMTLAFPFLHSRTSFALARREAFRWQSRIIYQRQPGERLLGAFFH